jgi:predicted Rossmann-fold nucleotide-binding protein
MRNKEMLDKNQDLDLVIAFPGGYGTQDMIRQSKKKSVQTIVIVSNTSYVDIHNNLVKCCFCLKKEFDKNYCF